MLRGGGGTAELAFCLMVNEDAIIGELRGLLPRCMLHDWVRLGSRLARLLRDRRHSAAHGPVLERLLARARESAALREWRAGNLPRLAYPPGLPITARKGEILEALRANQVIVVAGETGSGKTTQLPKICLEAGLGVEAKIGCTQPRRVAALSVSRRIAEELNVAWGREVGCKIRFDDRSSPETFIKMMTDGMLLAEAQGDPLLSEYNALVIDEAHERSLNIDFLLGHLKGLLEKRKDLKLIITSATIDTALFSKAFGNAPVIEVSGRVYPVEVRYEPIDEEEQERGEVTYVDAAARAAQRIVEGGGPGDVLIFMPGERDIRETADQLGGRIGDAAEIIPLYGRLTSGEQQRVFAPGPRRKVVIATNIAETSLTIPGIRYVIDSGLARISRYNPRTRTRRLPIEPISQSSANQRKGRAGRVEAGVCIRLYSEEDFESRPPFTQPEIQRSNLAEVILRMKAFHLGDIETFPFLNPPTPAAIQAGYTLLHELGALDEKRELTPLGADLARLPIDPTLGRMLLQSQREHATRELLIIAAGLSIQDPRERPADQQAAADAAHRRHADPRSDFLALLNVWNAAHEEWEALRTQNQRRKFCKANFLSYTRMREWQDLHAQLLDGLEELGNVRLNESNAEYAAVHRSVLAGLLAHVAQRQDRNQYRGTGNRSLIIFPGSSLFERVEKGKGQKGGRGERGPEAKSRQPAWIVAGELVETSQLYARTVAAIEPRWVVELAPHLCKTRHANPRWDAGSGRVVADEVVTFSGLEVQRRRVAYGPIDPATATEIFIRAALVEEGLLARPDPRGEDEEDDSRRSVPAAFAFLEHNRRAREKVESWQTRLRRTDGLDLDQALHDFYAKRLGVMSSRDELLRWLRAPGNAERLRISEAELTGGRDIGIDQQSFPDFVQVGGQPVELRYAYAPGEEHDGVTVRVPFTVADAVSPALLEWAVPGLREEKAEALLRALPRSVRSQLLPIAPKAAEIAREFMPTSGSLLQDLARFIRERYGAQVTEESWARDPLLPHLKTRIEVVDAQERVLAGGRDLKRVREQLARASAPPAEDSDAWQRAAAKWEKFGIEGWTFGDLPERIVVSEGRGLPVYGWLALDDEDGQAHLRLFRTQTAARERGVAGLRRLVELALKKEFAWTRKDARAGLEKMGPLMAGYSTPAEMDEHAYEHLRAHVLPGRPLDAMTQAEFQKAVEETRRRLQGWAPVFLDRMRAILEARRPIQQRIAGAGAARGGAAAGPSGGRRVVNDLSQLDALFGARAPSPTAAVAAPAPGAAELEALAPRDFLRRTPFDRLPHLPRYLKALAIRLDRAVANPPRDRERAQQVQKYADILKAFQAGRGSEERAREVEALRWMIEEYRVSLFAQELGTAGTISPKRLDEQVAKIRALS